MIENFLVVANITEAPHSETRGIARAMLRHFPLIARNSLRNRRRSALTISSIAVSLCLLLRLLMAMYRALFFGGETTPAQALRLMTRHKVSLAQPMPFSYGAKIEQVPAYGQPPFGSGLAALIEMPATRGTSSRASVWIRRAVAHPFRVRACRRQHAHFSKSAPQGIASKALADKFGWKPGERITLVGDIFPVTLELTLVGIFVDPDRNRFLFFNREYLRESLTADSGLRDTANASRSRPTHRKKRSGSPGQSMPFSRTPPIRP